MTITLIVSLLLYVLATVHTYIVGPQRPRLPHHTVGPLGKVRHHTWVPGPLALFSHHTCTVRLALSSAVLSTAQCKLAVPATAPPAPASAQLPNKCAGFRLQQWATGVPGTITALPVTIITLLGATAGLASPVASPAFHLITTTSNGTHLRYRLPASDFR
jgi:hypothetical protein